MLIYLLFEDFYFVLRLFIKFIRKFSFFVSIFYPQNIFKFCLYFKLQIFWNER